MLEFPLPVYFVAEAVVLMLGIFSEGPALRIPGCAAKEPTPAEVLEQYKPQLMEMLRDLEISEEDWEAEAKDAVADYQRQCRHGKSLQKRHASSPAKRLDPCNAGAGGFHHCSRGQ